MTCFRPRFCAPSVHARQHCERFRTAPRRVERRTMARRVHECMFKQSLCGMERACSSFDSRSPRPRCTRSNRSDTSIVRVLRVCFRNVGLTLNFQPASIILRITRTTIAISTITDNLSVPTIVRYLWPSILVSETKVTPFQPTLSTRKTTRTTILLVSDNDERSEFHLMNSFLINTKQVLPRLDWELALVTEPLSTLHSQVDFCQLSATNLK